MVPNEALYLALQVIPCLTCGGVGVAKSSILAALAEALGRAFVGVYGSNMLPEDFGGYPVPDHTAGIVRQMPPPWLVPLLNGMGFFLCDEVTNVQSQTQAGMLTVLTEKKVGDHTLPEDTIMVGACNPPELCPNATPLSAAMKNRFAHFPWEVNYDTWFTGLRAGCEWPAPTFPIVPAHWRDGLPQFGSLVEAFLRSAPDFRESMPTDETQMSFPTLRTWTYCVKACAAADAAGYAKGHPIYKELAIACVGEAAGSAFTLYVAKLDLLDPESFLSGGATYTYVKRPDANICLLTGLVRALRGNTTPERWTAASKVFVEIGKHEIESFLMAFRPFFATVSAPKNPGVRPDGWVPPAEVMSALMELVPQ